MGHPSADRQLHGFEVFLLLAVGVSLQGHVIAVPYLLRAGGREAWLGILLSLPLGLVAGMAWVALARAYPHTSLYNYLPRLVGPIAGVTLSALHALFVLLSAAVVCRSFAVFARESFLPRTPVAVLSLVLVAIGAFGAATGPRAVARGNVILAFWITAAGLYVAFLTTPNKEYGQLLPLLQAGWPPIWRAFLLSLGILGEVSFLGILLGWMTPDRRTARHLWWALPYTMVGVLGTTTAAVANWGEGAAALRTYPAFDGWRLISVAKVLGRTDLFALHQWMGGAFGRTAVAVWALASIGLSRPGQLPWPRLAIAAGLIWAASFLLPSQEGLDRLITGIYYPLALATGIVLPVLLWAWGRLTGRFPTGAHKHAG